MTKIEGRTPTGQRGEEEGGNWEGETQGQKRQFNGNRKKSLPPGAPIRKMGSVLLVINERN